MHEAPKCLNESCRCKVPRDRMARGDPYCSAHCAENAGAEGHPLRSCGCKHPPCGGGE